MFSRDVGAALCETTRVVLHLGVLAAAPAEQRLWVRLRQGSSLQNNANAYPGTTGPSVACKVTSSGSMGACPCLQTLKPVRKRSLACCLPRCRWGWVRKILLHARQDRARLAQSRYLRGRQSQAALGLRLSALRAFRETCRGYAATYPRAQHTAENVTTDYEWISEKGEIQHNPDERNPDVCRVKVKAEDGEVVPRSFVVSSFLFYCR